MRGFIFSFHNFRFTNRLVTNWILNAKYLLRTFSETYSISQRNERLTDTIIEIEELGWSSGSSSGCWLIVNTGFCSLRSYEEKIQKREVRKWGKGRKKFRLVELSRWIVASEWIIWTCTGYSYPDGHGSLLLWTRANRIIWWADRKRVNWFCRSEHAAKTIFVIGKFRWRDFCLGIISMMRILLWNHDQGEVKECFASGK